MDSYCFVTNIILNINNNKMKLFVSILFLFFYSTSFSQTYNIEQQEAIDLYSRVINDPNSSDTALVSAYVNLSNIIYISNVDTIIPLCRKAEKIANKRLKQNPDTEERLSLLESLATAYNNIGYYIDNYQNKTDTALLYYEESLEIQKIIKDTSGMATSVNNIGEIYRIQSNIPLALKYHHKSLKLRTAINHEEGMAQSLHNIALIHKQQGDYKLALKYNLNSLKIRKKTNDIVGLATSLNNIGTIHRDMNNHDLALDYFNQSFSIRKNHGDKRGMSNSLNNIGAIYSHKNKFDLALSYHKRALKIEEELKRELGIAKSLFLISSTEYKLGNINEADLLSKRALAISQKLGIPNEIENAADIRYQINLKKENWEEALKMRNLQFLMKDSMENEAAFKAAASEQAKYEYEKTLAISEKEHEKKLAIEQEAKAKQKIIIIAIAICLGLLAIFLFFVFNRLKVTRKQKKVIELAHVELEYKNQEITSSINYAKRIQKAILPPAKIVKEYLRESFIIYQPKDIVAGDFYWMEQSKNITLFAAADCTGHGVPGAMVSVICNNGLNRSVREYNLTDPGEILNKTREIVIQEFEKSEEEVKDGMDIALCSLENINDKWQLNYAGANNPLWIIRNSELIETKANKQPIGKFDNPTPYTTHSLELKKDDAIYIFSDGFVDQFGGPKGKKLKSRAFRELLLSVQSKNMESQKEIINTFFSKWKGHHEQIDDVCIIGVKI